jgi:hypothetical protein
MSRAEPLVPASDYAARFVPGLLAPAQDAPGMLAGVRDGASRRYDVHRNNVTVSLIEALAAIYPAVQRITGPDFFRAMARFHVRATPPVSPLLFDYGHGFPAFIEAYEHARDMPWLADTARIERAWLDAYHAADAPVLDAAELAAIDPDALASLRLRPHPATRIVRSRYPAVAIFTMNRTPGEVAPLRAGDAEDALVTRPDDAVLVSRLPPGGAVFLGRLVAGAELGEAVTAALDAVPAFDLGANLAGMVSAGVFSSLQP